MTDIRVSLRKNGWAKVNSVFTRDETDELASLANHLAKKQALHADKPVLIDESETGKFSQRKLAEPFFQSPRFRQTLFSQKIAQLINPIVGPGADLLFDHVFMKPSLFGAKKHWHQDGYYYDISPPENGITVWIALCNAHEENGCLRYIQGSHKLGLLPHTQPGGNPALVQVSLENVDLEKSVAVPANRGDVILHHYHALHGSGPNLSSESRIAYASHWLGKDSTGAGASWHKTYPLREQYWQLIKTESLKL